MQAWEGRRTLEPKQRLGPADSTLPGHLCVKVPEPGDLGDARGKGGVPRATPADPAREREKLPRPAPTEKRQDQLALPIQPSISRAP